MGLVPCSEKGKAILRKKREFVETLCSGKELSRESYLSFAEVGLQESLHTCKVRVNS